MTAGSGPSLSAHRTPLDWLLLMGLVVMWGSSFAVTKVAFETVPAEWIAAGRLSIGATILVPFVFLRGGSFTRSLQNLHWIAWLTLTGTALPFYLISWGTGRIDSGLAGMLMATVPLMVLLFAHALLPDERMTWPKALGVGIGFVGVVVLIGPDKLLDLTGEGASLWGQAAIIGATVCYGLHSTSTRRAVSFKSEELAAATLFAGALIAVPIAIHLAPDALFEASARSLVALLVLGTFQTATAALILYRLLATAGAGFTVSCNYLIPVFAVLLGAVWLGEQITARTVAGGALVLAGIAVSQQLYRRLVTQRRRAAR